MHQRQKAWWIRYGWLVLSLLVCCFSLHDQSFWIDECCTALCALQPDMQECWAKICGIGGSDAQIAFYYYLLFLWHQVTGAESEWALRLFNVFWVLLAAWFFRKEPRALLLLMVSPFLIYYTEELRPYILQIAASCGVSMLFYQVSRGAPVKFHALFGTLFFLCLTSLTGVAWALGFAAAFLVMATPQFGSRSFWKAACWWMIPFAVLAGYYVYTLTLGARAVEISSSWMVNAGASAYELMGLTGWGPPRTELRQYTTFASLWNVGGLKLAAAAGLVITAGLVYGMVRWKKESAGPVLPALLVLLLIPGAVFLYGTEAMNFRFSGRHCAPLLPVLCLIWSRTWSWNWRFPSLIRPVLFILMMAVWLVSDFRIRFNSMYSREDYRMAVSYCTSLQEDEINVLLVCNEYGSEFYGWHPRSSSDDWSEYDVIVVSRPELYDFSVKPMEDSGMYGSSALCQGFTIYRRDGKGFERREE